MKLSFKKSVIMLGSAVVSLLMLVTLFFSIKNYSMLNAMIHGIVSIPFFIITVIGFIKFTKEKENFDESIYANLLCIALSFLSLNSALSSVRTGEVIEIVQYFIWAMWVVVFFYNIYKVVRFGIEQLNISL